MQSKRMSLLEAVSGTLIGFVVSLVGGLVIYPMFGHSFTLAQNIGIVMVFTVLSVIRSYLVRRFFNWLHTWGKT